jgi:cyclophilin family peptidyl-prolyl cis-trans isomerase
MLKRICAATALLLVIQSGVVAQTMRFTTNVGSFDMELNPTNDPNLQPLVDNIVAYIGLGWYGNTAINRAVEGGPGTADDFVLQMGGFLASPPTPQNYLGLVREVQKLSPVIVDGPDADNLPDFTALSNTRGTVSLALQANQPNSGTSSFFINLKDNISGDQNLDAQGFVPFARVDDLTTVERIMALRNVDLNGAGPLSSFDDVPLTENDRLVVLQSVNVLQAAPNFSFVGPISAALDRLQAEEAAAAAASLSASLAADEGLPVLADPGLVVDTPPGSAVPEPATLALAGGALLLTIAAGRRRR